MNNSRTEHFAVELFRRFPSLQTLSGDFFGAYRILKETFEKSGTLFLCGNGGSCSDCDHIVGELMKGFLMKRSLPPEEIARMSGRLGENFSPIGEKLQKGLRAVSLNGAPALSTAFCNDVDPELSQAQQLFAMARPETDSVIGISTSGNAKNVLNVFKTAGALGIRRILLTGKDGGVCKKYADCVLIVPEKETYRIQELHLPVYHTLCMMLEEEFFGK